MDAKISSAFWDDELVEELPSEGKLCALWLLTCQRRTLCGYVDVNERKFVYQTGLTAETLKNTLEALTKGLPRAYQGDARPLVKVGRGYLWRNFIRKQFGGGNSLVRNNMAKQICREVDALGMEDLRKAVAKEYPELRTLLYSFSLSKSEALTKPLPSPYQGQEKSIEEHRREEQREEGAGETTSLPTQDDLLDPDRPEIAAQTSPPGGAAAENFAKKNGAGDFEKKGGAENGTHGTDRTHGTDGGTERGEGYEPCLAEQALRFAAIFGRGGGKRWSNMEEVALSQAQPVSDGDLRLIEWRYGQAEEERDPHRQKLLTLLQNLPGELDAARAQLRRQAGDRPANATPRQEPEGWREILEKKYRGPEDTEWTAPASFHELPDSVRAEILAEIKQQN